MYQLKNEPVTKFWHLVKKKYSGSVKNIQHLSSTVVWYKDANATIRMFNQTFHPVQKKKKKKSPWWAKFLNVGCVFIPQFVSTAMPLLVVLYNTQNPIFYKIGQKLA